MNWLAITIKLLSSHSNCAVDLCTSVYVCLLLTVYVYSSIIVLCSLGLILCSVMKTCLAKTQDGSYWMCMLYT